MNFQRLIQIGFSLSKTLGSQVLCYILFSTLSAGSIAASQVVRVAVASNFFTPMKEIKNRFESSSHFKVILSFASSGKLYAQIHNGAPYDIFLSADTIKPEKLIDEDLAIASSRITYAQGALVLWSLKPQSLGNPQKTLSDAKFNKLAIANPKLAPYGKAAIEVLSKLGARHVISGKKIVKGENISQAYQYVLSGNAQLGFVALSQIYATDRAKRGSYWLVDKNLYSAIRQDGVLLRKGEKNLAAIKLLQFLKTKEVKSLIANFGYSVN